MKGLVFMRQYDRNLSSCTNIKGAEAIKMNNICPQFLGKNSKQKAKEPGKDDPPFSGVLDIYPTGMSNQECQ